MKKLLFAAIPFLAVLLTTSCSNDDIVVETTGLKHNITLNVSTQSMYDEFGITNYIREQFLRDGSQVVGVTTFVYNSDGNLVKMQMTAQNNYNVATQEFTNFVDGDYTLVTVETLLNPDDDYKADSWSFDDIDKLTSLKISLVGYSYAGDVIGVATTELTLNNDVALNVTPKAIGSLVRYQPINFEESDLVHLGFATLDALKYYSLNPMLQRDDRFQSDLTKQGYINIRLETNVEKSTGYYWYIYLLESSIEWTPVVQDEEDVQETTWTGWNPEGTTELEDGKVYDAGAFYLYKTNEGDYYVRRYFGDTTDYSVWYNGWSNWKESHVYSFIAPYIDWSIGTVLATKSYMNENGCYLEQDITYSTEAENYYMLYSDAAKVYEYDFETRTFGLTDVYIAFDKSCYTVEQIHSEIITQGYTYLGTSQSGNHLYTSDLTSVIVTPLENVIYVNYYDKTKYSEVPMYKMPMSSVNTMSRILERNRLNAPTMSTKTDKCIVPQDTKESIKIPFK